MNARTAPLSAGYGIRCARPTESGAIAALLARAFTDDPVTAWMFPDPSDRERRTSRFFTRLQRQQRPRAGGVRVAATAEGQLLAAALWSGPGRWKPSAVRELAALPHYARVFGTDGLRRAADVENSLQEAHPEVPHWYLPTLGTAVQGEREPVADPAAGQWRDLHLPFGSRVVGASGDPDPAGQACRCRAPRIEHAAGFGPQVEADGPVDVLVGEPDGAEHGFREDRATAAHRPAPSSSSMIRSVAAR
ncbi:hypothetical protein [Streptomyces sp. H27-S2]|uniref:hypothetical protein n=1 Tax=Streptomyces antarcticus TaxID=2996458 RepID=UPI00226FD27C|nr:hypothetical protein [Streptomyces sp. H27-S2]MCY0954630.1 hypothetical protein [Streptomyces sp. H27-S2]